MAYLIIEHLEEISDWLWLEYSHVAEWWDKLVFTNVRDDERERLARLGGSVISESVTRFPPRPLQAHRPRPSGRGGGAQA